MTKEDIKQICQIYDNFRSERDAATIAYNSDNAFWEHILATYNLSHPSLPFEIDEAALKELQVYLPQGNGPDGICYFIAPQMLAMYKAGAEWMRGQGETYITHVEDASNDEERFPAIFIPVDSFKPGNKVVVQIRKKE